MSRALIITGATGNQGGAAIDALIADKASDFLILAVTRNTQSPGAQRPQAKSPVVKLVRGDLNDTSSLFAAARDAAGTVPLWGVYSVQGFMGKGASLESEERQGKALIDQSIKAGIKHFVYSSVERGGDEKSWADPTTVPHFITKHAVEHHLRDEAAKDGDKMGWTILRPVMFMDNLQPGFPTKVFLASLRDTLGEKPVQWVAVKDIGFAVAQAFSQPVAWNHKAVGLAGDNLTFAEVSAIFEKVTGSPAPATFGLLGKALKMASHEMGAMINWFHDEGFGADIEANRKSNPHLTSFEAWLRSSAYARKA
ncbi:uncharacterized protein F5Z01DRAFT_546326 [Emericellopsis atlantica]|uniref:NmrA-like domain-containing protein n=1 Tax=Emericellopsis atlantica TaxID=2614577 RepID=A0A9P7ZNU7_9HYPO|nr:uncharacterized protein F5Z01DRAFT_546326 [Emericellopsis atlantica]KAG9255548.1 hypothetical protein F5Z01DRAFT_546326 [Emericellopsis atlantica]